MKQKAENIYDTLVPGDNTLVSLHGINATFVK